MPDEFALEEAAGNRAYGEPGDLSRTERAVTETHRLRVRASALPDTVRPEALDAKGPLGEVQPRLGLQRANALSPAMRSWSRKPLRGQHRVPVLQRMIF